MLTVSELYIYPIKSLGGIQVQAATLTNRGFQYDRRWMLVDAYNNFLSQRTVPQMALLQVQLSEDCLLVMHPHHSETLRVPFEPSGESCMVTVWDDLCSALYVSGEADEWFSRM